MDWIGFAAAACTTVSFVPQAVQVIRTRDTAALSLGMYVVFTLGVSLWLVYGVMKRDLALMGANVVTLTLASTILVAKIRNERGARSSASER